MGTDHDEPRRRSGLPRWLALAPVVGVAGIATWLVIARHRVEVSLWNDTGGTLRNVRVTYSGGEDHLDDIVPGSRTLHGFRPGRSLGPGEPSRYEAILSCDLADGQTLRYPLGSSDIEYWARKHVRITLTGNGGTHIFGYDTGGTSLDAGRRWLSGLLNIR